MSIRKKHQHVVPYKKKATVQEKFDENVLGRVQFLQKGQVSEIIHTAEEMRGGPS